jgi:hypothetical protein
MKKSVVADMHHWPYLVQSVLASVHRMLGSCRNSVGSLGQGHCANENTSVRQARRFHAPYELPPSLPEATALFVVNKHIGFRISTRNVLAERKSAKTIRRETGGPGSDPPTPTKIQQQHRWQIALLDGHGHRLLHRQQSNLEKCITGTRHPKPSPLARVGCQGTMPEKQHDPPGRRVSIIERWPCELEVCRNYGQMCYWTISDEVENHLPITSIVMQFWLAAISRGECTAEMPPPAVLEQWAAHNLRSLQRREERKEERREQRAERKSSARRSSTRKSSTRRSSPQKSSVPSKG